LSPAEPNSPRRWPGEGSRRPGTQRQGLGGCRAGNWYCERGKGNGDDGEDEGGTQDEATNPTRTTSRRVQDDGAQQSQKRRSARAACGRECVTFFRVRYLVRLGYIFARSTRRHALQSSPLTIVVAGLLGCMVGVPVQVLGRALLCCMAPLAPPKTRWEMCGPGDEAIPWLARQHGGRGWGSQVVCCVGVGAGVGIGAGGMARRGALVDESMSMQDEDYLREPSRSGRDREGGQALGRVVREGKRAGGSPVRTFLQLYDVLYKRTFVHART